MVVPLATGVSGNDDYQRAWGRRKTSLQGTDSFGSLPFLRERREETWEILSSEYIKWGLARGEHEAQEMLRGIEAQAAAQARQHGGRPL